MKAVTIVGLCITGIGELCLMCITSHVHRMHLVIKMRQPVYREEFFHDWPNGTNASDVFVHYLLIATFYILFLCVLPPPPPFLFLGSWKILDFRSEQQKQR